jgi:hypothetical protein
MYCTHKDCCGAFEAAQGDGQAWSAIDLESLPYFLARNLHGTWQQAPARARAGGSGAVVWAVLAAGASLRTCPCTVAGPGVAKVNFLAK